MIRMTPKCGIPLLTRKGQARAGTNHMVLLSKVRKHRDLVDRRYYCDCCVGMPGLGNGVICAADG